MLCLNISVSESIRSEKLFDLVLVGFDAEHRPEFRLSCDSPLVYAVRSPSGAVSAGVAYPGDAVSLVVSWESRLSVGGATVLIRKWRASKARLVIDAPERIQFFRPAQHCA